MYKTCSPSAPLAHWQQPVLSKGSEYPSSITANQTYKVWVHKFLQNTKNLWLQQHVSSELLRTQFLKQILQPLPWRHRRCSWGWAGNCIPVGQPRPGWWCCKWGWPGGCWGSHGSPVKIWNMKWQQNVIKRSKKQLGWMKVMKVEVLPLTFPTQIYPASEQLGICPTKSTFSFSSIKLGMMMKTDALKEN